MVGILLSYWGCLFSGATLVSGRVARDFPYNHHHLGVFSVVFSERDKVMPCYQQRTRVVSPFDPGSSYKPRVTKQHQLRCCFFLVKNWIFKGKFMDVEPKIGGFPPKWLVKIMENPIKMG